MKKLWMVLLLGVVGILLVGCSTYEVTEEDWHIITTYGGTGIYLPEHIDVFYGPFINKKEEMNAIETYEELERRLATCRDQLQNYKKEDFKEVDENFFDEYLIYNFWLYVSGVEKYSGINVENLYVEGKTLHIPIVFNAGLHYSGSDIYEEIIYLAVKKDVVDKVNKVEREFVHRYDEEKGSRYYQYK